MARRRDAGAEAAREAGDPPEHLLRWDGQYVDHDEPVPDWWEHGAQAYRNAGGWSRWLAARRAWCKERGLDYWATFRPGSLERTYYQSIGGAPDGTAS